MFRMNVLTYVVVAMVVGLVVERALFMALISGYLPSPHGLPSKSSESRE